MAEPFAHFIQSGSKQLRCGYTTGTCSALAALGAATLLLTGTAPGTVSVLTPKGWTVEVVPEFCKTTETGVSCGIVKDAGDDPDITDGMTVVATLSRRPKGDTPFLLLEGGEGVGRVTKPGLDQPVGEPAINRVPRQMVENTLRGLLEELELSPEETPLTVTLSIPGGAERALKTFNPKLGVEGGLSILGTSGIVEPMSEQAMVDTIGVELRQALALQQETGAPFTGSVLLTPGNYGSDYLKETGLAETGVPIIRMSNYVGTTIDAAVAAGYHTILLVGHIGKFVKLAGGIMNTHSSVADCRLELFAAHAALQGASANLCQELMKAATTDAAIDLLLDAGLLSGTLQSLEEAVQQHLTRRVEKLGATDVTIGAILFSNVHGTLCTTKPAKTILQTWRPQHEPEH